MSAPAPVLDRLAPAFATKLPPTRKEEADAGLDVRAWLADSVEVSAVAAAEKAFVGLFISLADDPRASGDLARHVEGCGLVPLFAWAETVTLAGFGQETWAREAALRAVAAYRDRLADLMDASGVGGRP